MIFILRCIAPYKRPMLVIIDVTHTFINWSKSKWQWDTYNLKMYFHGFRIDHWNFPEGAVSPCCDRDLKQLPRSHTLFRRSTLFDIQATDVVLWWVSSCLETQHIHFTQTKVQSISMNTWDSDHAFTQRYVHMPANTTHVKKILGQWIKMTLCTYFVHVCSLLSIQAQPGFKIYCIGPRVLLQLWFSLILGVLGRRPHP